MDSSELEEFADGLQSLGAHQQPPSTPLFDDAEYYQSILEEELEEKRVQDEQFESKKRERELAKRARHQKKTKNIRVRQQFANKQIIVNKHLDRVRQLNRLNENMQGEDQIIKTC
jgi:hypothetical protein